MAKHLKGSTFKAIVESTPLVSIDLLVINSKKQILLGLRKNRPAKGLWFVPGGRIYKNETFEQAFGRLTLAELGESIELSEAKSIGHYQHFYQDGFSGPDSSTHYVTLGYQIERDITLESLPKDQHDKYQFWELNKLLASESVHSNTKAYFITSKHINKVGK